MLERSAEPEIGNRRRVSRGFERGGDVLHAEGLDAEERPEAETLVPGHRTQQDNVHGRAVKRNIAARSRSKRTARPTFMSVTGSRHSVVVAAPSRGGRARCRVPCRGVGGGHARPQLRHRRAVSLLPRDGRIVPAFRIFLESFGSVDELYVVLHRARRSRDRRVRGGGRRLGRVACRRRRRSRVSILAAPTARATSSWFADRRAAPPCRRALGRALSPIQPDGLARASPEDASCWPCRRRQLPDMVSHDPLGLLRSAARGARRRAGRHQPRRDRGRIRVGRPSQPPADRQAGAAAVRRRFLPRADDPARCDWRRDRRHAARRPSRR